MPKNPHTRREMAKKLNAINSVPPTNAEAKKQVSDQKKKKNKKNIEKKAKQKINIEVSVSCGLARTGRKLGGAAWGGWCKWWGSN